MTYPFKQWTNLLVILVCSIALTGCETIKKVPQLLPANKTIPVSAEQFNCGPPAAKIPDNQTLQTWTSSDLLDWGTDGWLWGERCSIANELNRYYFECAIDKKKESCTSFQLLNKQILERKSKEATVR